MVVIVATIDTRTARAAEIPIGEAFAVELETARFRACATARCRLFARRRRAVRRLGDVEGIFPLWEIGTDLNIGIRLVDELFLDWVFLIDFWEFEREMSNYRLSSPLSSSSVTMASCSHKLIFVSICDGSHWHCSARYMLRTGNSRISSSAN